MKRSHGKASGDFAKKKRKVGKGKRVAENATEVSFKSRAVVVPSQLTGTADPTSNRKLSLQVKPILMFRVRDSPISPH